MATGVTAKSALLGTWRIVETELWDLDDLDLIEPAHLTLEPKGRGKLGLLAIEATIDYRVVQREGLPAIEFSFEGFDEGDRMSGRGWAVCEGARLRGWLFFHQGDESAFTASRGTRGAAPSPRRRR